MNKIKELLSNLAETKYKSFLLLFIVAFLFRLLIVYSYYPGNIAKDSSEYYNLAVNLVNGNGYSVATTEPFVPRFFREPGYPVFLAAGLEVYKLTGGEVNYLTVNENSEFQTIPDSITFLRGWQALLDSLSILLFFSLLNIIMLRKYAFLFSFILAIYFPITIYCTYILRECFVSFLFILLTYCIAKFLLIKKTKYFLWLSIISGITILTFRVYMVLPVFIFIFIYLYMKEFKYSIIKTLYCGVIIFLITLPWLFYVYTNYSDFRIIKTFGCSLTNELMNYANAVETQNYYAKRLPYSIDLQQGLPSKDQFERSFNGYYKTKTDSINKLVNEPFFTKRKMEKLGTALRKTVFFNKIAPMDTSLAFKRSPVINGSLILITFVVGVIGCLGIILFYRRLFIISFSAFLHLPLFFVLGTEYRRSLPAQSFILLSCCVVLTTIFLYKYKSLKFIDAVQLIFK
jgi:hypothetical protein